MILYFFVRSILVVLFHSRPSGMGLEYIFKQKNIMNKDNRFCINNMKIFY
ncbi:hypothetical protein APHACPA_1138 [Rickettsia amblyommatis str. Ac/Pa]|uniref:Uncharacterized protein n=1 Tax=Rickettsia amblyommatis str. Ac/Pa TaxID=1359164 RepID=A0A0F3N298_RICAM|nr:hypothetical protein APHACPA_1138 [Rickettsia amblyommatis str. Ac/Pa]